MRGVRRDGLPAERDHAVYSERQRVIVLTFPTVEEAQSFDTISDEMLERLLGGEVGR